MVKKTVRFTKKVSTSFTRPDNVTAYAALDALADKTADATILSFADAVPVDAEAFEIVQARLRIDDATGIASDFRLHLYSSAPTVVVDNAAFNLIAADRAKYLGYFTWADPVDLGNTQWAQVAPTFKAELDARKGSNATLYGMLQTVDGFTPVAECVFTIELLIALI